MSTLRTFLERSPIDRAPLFEGLQVWDSENARKHFQRYPVIFLSFKDAKCNSWPDTYREIRKLCANEALRHRDLLNDPAIAPEVSDNLRRIMREHDDLSLYHGMLRDLSTLLTAHYGEQTVILIDEYDAPIHAAYVGGFYNEAVTFFRNFLSAGLKDNRNLFKAAMTGVLRVAKESLFSGLNNVEVRSVLDSEYATAFGFTEPEVEKLAQDMGAPEVADELRSWYDGYRIGGHSIYNPWSVLSYAKSQDREFLPHWLNTGSDDVLRSLVFEKGRAITQELEALIRGETVSRVISDHVVLRDLDTDPKAVWSLLLMAGYLTVRSRKTVGGRIHAELAIPNQEVRIAFEDGVMNWLDLALMDTPHPAATLSKAMLEGNVETFEDLLSDMVKTTLSYHDTGGRQPESVYQAFILGMLVFLADGWNVRSNQESGDGRYDLAVIPKQPGKPGVILELKKQQVHRGQTVDQALDSAMAQIRDRRYTVELEAAGAEPILQYGVVFDGKRVWVRKG